MVIKKWIALALAVMMAISISGMAFAQPPDLPVVPGPKQSLVALGDSITAGYGLERNLNMVSRKAYPQLLGDEIGYRVTNLAVAGMTSGEVLDAVQNNNRYRNAITRADVIILNVGGADLLGVLSEVMNPYTPDPDPVQFVTGLSSNIMSILEQIKDLNPEVSILLFNIYEPYPIATLLPDDIYNELLLFLYGVNQMISTFAMNPDIYLVDAYKAYDEYPGDKLIKAYLLFVDEVHPSELGQELLYDAALEVYRSFCGEMVTCN